MQFKLKAMTLAPATFQYFYFAVFISVTV